MTSNHFLYAKSSILIQEALELDLLSRQTSDVIRDPSDVIHRQASDYVIQDPNFNTSCGMSQPNLVKLVAQASQNGNLYLGDQQVVDLSQKPWDHHNNLNDSYFTPVKGEQHCKVHHSCNAMSRTAARLGKKK